MIFARLRVLIIALICPAFMTGQPATQHDLNIYFHNFAGMQELKDGIIYQNELGQSFTVTNFKYYISNLSLQRADGSNFIAGGYFLVQDDEDSTKRIQLDHVPPGEYTTISFTIGVDSLHNCSGAQSGALDLINGMYWSWNSGYIFLKLEGRSPACTSPGQIFEYHIGGYRAPSNCIRQVSLKLPETLVIKPASQSSIDIKTDLTEILKTPFTIDFSKLPSVTDSHNASLIADNYEDMFSIISGNNEK